MTKLIPAYSNMLHQEQLTDLMLQVAYVCGKENRVLNPGVQSTAKLQLHSFHWLCKQTHGLPRSGKMGGSSGPVGIKARRVSPALVQKRKDCF